MKWILRVVVGVMVVILAFGAMGQNVAREGGISNGPAPQAAPRGPQSGFIFTPASSIQRPEDAGLRAHTNYVFRSADGKMPKGLPAPQALNTQLTGVNPDLTVVQETETPSSLGCLYVGSPSHAGCPPNYSPGSGGPSAAGWGALVLVDAYDNPYAASDIASFDTYWGLPEANFVKVWANGNGDCPSGPPQGQGWDVEESLDIEWAHVFAPSAAVILVEACSNSYTDMLYAEQVGFDWAYYYGGGEVSNSWGSGEFSGENTNDPLFSSWGEGLYGIPITAFVSAGDGGCYPAYPTVDPWVVSAGGTSVYRQKSNSHFLYEGCWNGSGGGFSYYEVWTPNGYWQDGTDMGPWADYQYPMFGESNRAIPDFAGDADPSSGVWIYNQYSCEGWCVVGGTSVSSPSLAGIVNRSNNRLSSCWFNPIDSTCYFYNAEDTLLYSQLPTYTAYSKNFYDITAGSNGCPVAQGWDYCTGVGSPRGLLGK